MRKLLAVLAFGVFILMTLVRPPIVSAQSATKEGPPPMTVKVGDKVPDFTLKDQNGKDVSLHDYLGKKNLVLAFYVFAFTGG